MYPADRRLTLFWRYQELNSIRLAAKSMRVSKSTAQRWVHEMSHDRVVSPIQKRKPRKKRLAARVQKTSPLVEDMIIQDPFMTCRELADKIGCCKELVRRCIHRLGLSFKKARYYGVARNAEDLNTKFIHRRNQYILEGRPIYSVDETGFGRFSYTQSHGWSPIGQPLRVQKRKARETSTSVIACACASGWVKYTPIMGGVNRSAFCAFLKSLDLEPSAVLLLDNASIHKGEAVRSVCAEKGITLLYVPPYSPWFNPIELCFSIVKRRYPKTSDIASSFDYLDARHFTSFFKHSLRRTGCEEVKTRPSVCRPATDEPAVVSAQRRHKRCILDVNKPHFMAGKRPVNNNKADDHATAWKTVAERESVLLLTDQTGARRS